MPKIRNKRKHILARIAVFSVIAIAYAVSVIWYGAPINAYLHLSRSDGNGAVNGAAADGAVKIYYIDVGQGDASLIEFPDGKDMIVDSGPSAGQANLMNFFAGLQPKIAGFDYVLLTHSDADHCDNFPALLSKYPLKPGGVVYRPNQESTYAGYTDPALSLVKAAGAHQTFWGAQHGTVSTRTYSQCLTALYAQAQNAGGKVIFTDVTNADSVIDTTAGQKVLNGTLTLYSDMDFYGGAGISGDGAWVNGGNGWAGGATGDGGAVLQPDDYVVRFYGPTVPFYGTAAKPDASANNYSPIFTVDCEGERALFSGDCEAVAEQNFVRDRGGMFDTGEEITGQGVNVIKLGHHGSSTSSCAQYLDAVLPSDNTNTIAVASANHAGNNYNLPSASVIKLLTDSESDGGYGFNPGNVLKTEALGTIAVAFTANGVVCGDAVVTIPRPALQWASIGAAIVFVAAILIFAVPLAWKKTV